MEVVSVKTKIFLEAESGAGQMIREGGLVAVPTETVYGLAGNGLDEAAVRQIYEVKGRPPVKPLSLMVPDQAAMALYCDPIPESAKTLAEKFWPGPLTIVLNSRELVPEIVRAGGATVGLRCPDNVLTLNALAEAGVPFAAPSANPSGEPSPKTAEEVLRYFDGKIDGVIDGGPCTIGTESTLIDLSRTPYRILRQGALPYEQIADALAEKMDVLGITGPSGCGKTIALDVFRKVCGEDECLCVDCDVLYHRLLETEENMIAELNAMFPEAAEMSEDGHAGVNRQKLGNVVFREPEKLKLLNELTHHYIVDALKRLIREHAMNGGKTVIIDASELAASGAADLCDTTLAILAPFENRLDRIMERDHLTREQAELRLRAQHDDSYYREHVSYILENKGSLEDFENTLICFIKKTGKGVR